MSHGSGAKSQISATAGDYHSDNHMSEPPAESSSLGGCKKDFFAELDPSSRSWKCSVFESLTLRGTCTLETGQSL